jgi:hypothetical protein
MAYEIKYDSDADVLTVILKERGKLSHAEEVEDIIVHTARKVSRCFQRSSGQADLSLSWLKAWQRKKSPWHKPS